MVEDNAFQGVFFSDLRFRRFLHDEGIVMKPTSTGAKNKHSRELGVSTMAPDFHEGRVILPYATIEARRKVDGFIRQLVNWTGDTGPTRTGKSDILMAAWFPHATVIRRFNKISFPPAGVAGGAAGSPARFVVRPGSEGEVETKASARFEMKAGERFLLQSAGGGGYGEPSRRDAAAVAADIAEGYVTKER